MWTTGVSDGAVSVGKGVGVAVGVGVGVMYGFTFTVGVSSKETHPEKSTITTIIGKNIFKSYSPSIFAISLAKYVIIISAPARFMDNIDS